MIKDFIIIGAGLSGLNIAKKIKELDLGEALILEKSRGIGGRMATRRTLNTKFDHGAQFYRVKPDISNLHQHWIQKEISHQWFVSELGEHWCAKLGMTALAKSLGEGIEIALEKQVRTIELDNNLWKIVSDKDETWLCKKIIITAPLPQTIKLLEDLSTKGKLDLEALKAVKKINYTKALIGLVTLQEDIEISEYQEFKEGAFFSISNQKLKKVSDVPAFTLTMSPEFSEEFFDQDEELIMGQILKEFKTKYGSALIKSSELKKWRYCQPTSKYKNYFLEIAENLYLIGDAFGGSSLLGALRSSDALADRLNSKEIK